MGEEISAGEDLLFATMLVMAAGTFVFYNLSRLGLPYTVIMFLLGLLLGLISNYSDSHDRLMSLFEKIPPNLLFHIFLPVLIFEGSYGVKPHALRNIFGPALVLATVGLIINTLIVGVACKLFIYDDWSWYAVFLLGSILSATDPVAVVTLLKDLGVDANLTAVIDAEALMNDGTAIICFKLLLPAAISGALDGSWSSLLLQCIRLTVGAAFFGLLVGFVMLKVLRQCEGHDLVTTIQTICFAYIAYFVADALLETSGVLMLFTAGTFLASNYPSQFPGSHHSMLNSTWHFMVHSLNTVIFSLVGVVIARRSFSKDFNVGVFGTMFFMYVVCTVARAFMLIVLLPLLNATSRFKLTWREVCLQVHGGLRGGVATILVLVVAQSALPSEMQTGFLHITCGMVVLTLVVNAATAGAVVRRLDLHAKPQNRMTQISVGVQNLQEVLRVALTEAKNDPLLASANWPIVHRIAAGLENPYEKTPSIPEDELAGFVAILMRVFKTDVFRQRDAGRCTEDVAKVLIALAQHSIGRRTLSSIADQVPQMDYPFYIRWADGCAGKSAFLHRRVLQLKKSHDTWFFGLLLAYGDALDSIERVLPEYAQTADQSNAAERWLERERQEMSQLLLLFQTEKPQATVAVFTSIAATQVMKQAAEAVHHLHHAGFSEYDTGALTGAVADAMAPITELPPEIDAPTAAEIFQLSPIGRGLSDVTIAPLSRAWSVEVARQGTQIELGAALGIVTKGIAALVAQHEAPLVPGSVWGAETHVVAGHKAPMVLATTDVEYIKLGSDKVQQYMTEDMLFAETVRATAARAIAEELLVQSCRLASVDDGTVPQLCQDGQLVTAPHDAYAVPDMTASEGAVLFVCGADQSGFVGPATMPFIVPRGASFKWTRGTLLFSLPAMPVGEGVHQSAHGHGGGHGGPHASPTSPSAFVARHRARMSAVQSSSDFVATDSHLFTSPSSMLRPATDIAAPLASGAPASTGVTVAPPALSLAALVPGGPAISVGLPMPFSPEMCVSPVPFLNRYALLFLVEHEQLHRAGQAFAADQSYKRRQAVLRSTDHAMQFLARFTANLFPREEALFGPDGAVSAGPGVWAVHKARQAAFTEALGRWLERRASADEVIHGEVLAEMAKFAASHFPAAKTIGAAAIQKADGRAADTLRKLDSDAAVSDFVAKRHAV